MRTVHAQFTVLSVALATLAVFADPWDETAVSTVASGVTVQTRLVLDASDAPRIAYYVDDPNGDDALYYAEWNAISSQFIVGQLHKGEGVGKNPSLALASGYQPRIAFDANGYLYYTVRYPGSGWVNSYVNTKDPLTQEVYGGADPKCISLGTNYHNNPCIAYAAGENRELYYAWYSNSWWRQSVGTPVPQGVESVSLAFDANGIPGIAFGSPSGLHYAWWPGTQYNEWVINPVVGGDAGQYLSLALDANGYPHISYYDGDNGDLMYVYADASGWKTPYTVDSVGDVGQFNSLALDSQGKPHISYYDASSGALKYAYEVNPWYFEIIEIDAGEGSWMALDSTGKARVSYVDPTSGEVSYGARRTAAGVIPEPLSMAFMASAFVGVVGCRARRRRKEHATEAPK